MNTSIRYDIKQKSINKLYKNLKKKLSIFNIKQRIILKKTLYNRCKLNIILSNTYMRVQWIDRSQYNDLYGGDTFIEVLLHALFLDFDPVGVMYTDCLIRYKSITKIVYNSKMQRLEIHGTFCDPFTYENNASVFYLYKLINLKDIVNTLEYSCDMKVDII